MARKVTTPLPRVEPLPVAGQEPLVPPDVDEQPKRKPGRPSKAELEARRAAELAESAIKPKDLINITGQMLVLYSQVIRADGPTVEEVEHVNGALVLVVNKYGGRFKYFEEVVLLLALGTTTLGMKARAKEKARAAARRVGGPGAEGVGEIGSGPAVLVAGPPLDQH